MLVVFGNNSHTRFGHCENIVVAVFGDFKLIAQLGVSA